MESKELYIYLAFGAIYLLSKLLRRSRKKAKMPPGSEDSQPEPTGVPIEERIQEVLDRRQIRSQQRPEVIGGAIQKEQVQEHWDRDEALEDDQEVQDPAVSDPSEDVSFWGESIDVMEEEPSAFEQEPPAFEQEPPVSRQRASVWEDREREADTAPAPSQEVKRDEKKIDFSWLLSNREEARKLILFHEIMKPKFE